MRRDDARKSVASIDADRRRRRARRVGLRAAVAVMAITAAALALVACETATGSRPQPAGTGGTRPPASETHEIDLGDGRTLFMVCAGEGADTVVLESGYHESSDTWMITAEESDRSVFDRLADRYRVCAYDRAGTLLLTESPSVTDRTTPVPMPRTAADVVEDLHTALAASREQGPFILTAHSMGGLFARLYAQTYPDELAGLVFVDSVPIELRQLFGDKWSAYYAVLNATGGGDQGDGYEQVDIDASIAQIQAAGPFPPIPIGVISKDLPFAGLPANPAGFTADDLERAWAAGQPELVALRPNTPHLIATGSDHYVHVRQPDLVEAIVDIVAGRTIR